MASQVVLYPSKFDSRLTSDIVASSTNSIRKRRVALAILALAVAPLLGCGSGTSQPTPSDPTILRGVVSTYRVAARDLRRPPQSMDDLASVLKPVTDDPSQYLRSKRDGQDFVVVWGLNLDTATPDTVVAYERTGADGKRMVVTAAADVREVTPEEFAALKFPADHEPVR